MGAELTTGMPDFGQVATPLLFRRHHHHDWQEVAGRYSWSHGSRQRHHAYCRNTRDQDVVPRLIAAGADLSRVAFLKKIRKDKKERMFLLGEDLDVLEQMIRDIKNVGAVFTDPITAYMGKINSNMTTDVRGRRTIEGPCRANERRIYNHHTSTQSPKLARNRSFY